MFEFIILLIFVTIIFIILLKFLSSLLKIKLRSNERIIKQGTVIYSGRRKLTSFLLRYNYGKLYLTNQRLLLMYYRFSKEEIEIPINKIKNVKRIFMDLIKIEYTNGKTDRIYFIPFRIFIRRVRAAEGWVKKIKAMIK